MRFALLLGLLTSTAAGAEPVALPGLLGAAVTATDEARYCDALYLFEALHLRAPSPRALYNSAEVAFAAGDRVKALDLYRATQRLYPDFEKKKIVQERADSVFSAMVKAGPGTACAVRTDVCGDWMLRPVAGGEQCDDGNLTDGDGCDHDCTTTVCGNGITTVGEVCDDGNRVDGDGCDSNCSASACGNARRAGAEQCDDGNGVDGDGCDHGCVVTGCGNGVATVGEECDDGNNDNSDGCDGSCHVARCGNSVITGLEQCDDGNAVAGDGCEIDCTRTRVKRPLPGIVVGVVSAIGVAGGAGLVAVGSTPFANHGQASDDLAAAEASYRSDPEGSLTKAAEARDLEERSRLEASSWGGPAIVGGGLLAISGLIGLGVGVWMAATDTEIDGGLQ